MLCPLAVKVVVLRDDVLTGCDGGGAGGSCAHWL